MVGPWKWTTKLLRQTFGERFLTTSNFLTNSRVCWWGSRQFRHKKLSRYVSDVITYPLIQETFAFVESNLECRLIDNILELDSVRNKSEKGIAKKVSFTIMRFPRWTIDCHYKRFGSAACWMIVWRFTKLTYSRNVAQRPSTKRSQVDIGAWLRSVVTQGNLGDRPVGSSPNNNLQIDAFAGGFKYRIRV
jgi:hypothetical protein